MSPTSYQTAPPRGGLLFIADAARIAQVPPACSHLSNDRCASARDAARSAAPAHKDWALPKQSCHEPVLIRCRVGRHHPPMAPLARKVEAEWRMRELLETGGLPQPDEIEYHDDCIRLFFRETQVVIIVELDSPEASERSEVAQG